MSNLTPEQLIAKWPVGKIIELSAETAREVAIYNRVAKVYTALMQGLEKRIGDKLNGNVLSIESAEEKDSVQKVIEEVLEEIGSDAKNYLDMLLFDGEGINVNTLAGIQVVMRLKMLLNHSSRMLWSTIYSELCRTYNVDAKEWNQIRFSFDIEHPSVITVSRLVIEVTETKEQNDARLSN